MPEIDASTAPMRAWVLTPNKLFKIALDESSMAEYILEPQLYPIPDAVNYCNQVVLWRNDFVPVVDLNLVLGEPAIGAQHMAVLAYQEYDGQKPLHVAMKLVGEVERVDVMDDMACDWPEDYPLEMQPLVESLFMNQDELMSVINLADLCNEGYRDYLAQLTDVKAAALS